MESYSYLTTVSTSVGGSIKAIVYTLRCVATMEIERFNEYDTNKTEIKKIETMERKFDQMQSDNR